MKSVVSQDTRQTIAPHLKITMRAEVVFSNFVDGAPHLTARVREVDGIDSYFSSLQLLIVEP